MPVRIQKRGRPPSILTVDQDEKYERWHFPTAVDKLTDEQKKLIQSCVSEQTIRIVFSTHYFKFEGDIYHQQTGCPMGSKPSGPVSRLMVDETVETIEEIAVKTTIMNRINPILYEELILHLIDIYVDDTLTAMDKMKLGIRYDNSQKIFIWTSKHREKIS